MLHLTNLLLLPTHTKVPKLVNLTQKKIIIFFTYIVKSRPARHKHGSFASGRHEIKALWNLQAWKIGQKQHTAAATMTAVEEKRTN